MKASPVSNQNGQENKDRPKKGDRNDLIRYIRPNNHHEKSHVGNAYLHLPEQRTQSRAKTRPFSSAFPRVPACCPPPPQLGPPSSHPRHRYCPPYCGLTRTTLPLPEAVRPPTHLRFPQGFQQSLNFRCLSWGHRRLLECYGGGGGRGGTRARGTGSVRWG